MFRLNQKDTAIPMANRAPCQKRANPTRPLECAPGGGQNERIGLTPLAGLPEDGSHDEASITQRRVQAASC